ncbi:MAG: SAM-dependent methyltransferase [Myxococcales bacterium]|nr:SAM-dependent methyltransferase [Myxococcales bacterium]
MRRNGSLTARFVALFRAGRGLDPYAERVLDPALRLGLAAFRGIERTGFSLDRISSGLIATTVTRHSHFDACLLAAREAGIDQVVLLGAGFDARPWRFADALAGARVFLVDHPATAALRAERFADLPAPPGVVRVDVDFATEDFAVALRAAGYATDRPAVFIWEGVSMYLPREAIAETLRRVAGLAAPGSRLVFDTWRADARGVPGVLERLGRGIVRAMGEPIAWNPTAEEVAALVTDSGLHLTAQRPANTYCAEANPAMWLVEAAV